MAAICFLLHQALLNHSWLSVSVPVEQQFECNQCNREAIENGEKKSYEESEGVRSPKGVLKFLSSHLVFVEICKKLTENIQKSEQHCFMLYCPLYCRVYDFVQNIDVGNVIFLEKVQESKSYLWCIERK